MKCLYVVNIVNFGLTMASRQCSRCQELVLQLRYKLWNVARALGTTFERSARRAFRSMCVYVRLRAHSCNCCNSTSKSLSENSSTVRKTR